MKQSSTLMVAVLVLAPSVCAADLRARTETGLRKSLAFYEQQQHGGGWASAYSLDLTSRWGEWQRVDKNVITVNHSATTGIGLIFLKASKLLDEPSWENVARNAGDLLIDGQLPGGGFPEELRLTDAGVKAVGGQGVLEDHATDRAIELLLPFDRSRRIMEDARRQTDRRVLSGRRLRRPRIRSDDRLVCLSFLSREGAPRKRRNCPVSISTAEAETQPTQATTMKEHTIRSPMPAICLACLLLAPMATFAEESD